MIPVCLALTLPWAEPLPLLHRALALGSALTLRWAETWPLLRWARVPLFCP